MDPGTLYITDRQICFDLQLHLEAREGRRAAKLARSDITDAAIAGNTEISSWSVEAENKSFQLDNFLKSSYSSQHLLREKKSQLPKLTNLDSEKHNLS